MAVDLSGFTLGLGNVNWSGMLGSVALYSMITIVVGSALGFWGWNAYQKKTYATPIKLSRILDNGLIKNTTGIKGGKKVNRSGVMEFLIKVPKQWKKKNLGYMPDMSMTDGDGALHFITRGDGVLWQQCKEVLIEEKEYTINLDGNKEEKIVMKLLLEPIPTDIKQATINQIHAVENLTEKNKLTAYGITIFGIVIMVIAHLISLWIQTKIKCGVPA